MHISQHSLNCCKDWKENRTVAYFGSVTFKVPTGRISIDFPQNLFFHLISEYNSERFTKLKRLKSPFCSDLYVRTWSILGQPLENRAVWGCYENTKGWKKKATTKIKPKPKTRTTKKKKNKQLENYIKLEKLNVSFIFF